MKMILSEPEAEIAVTKLSDSEKAEIERDKIRFGEYFIQASDNHFTRVNPIDVVIKNGTPELIDNSSVTLI